MRRRAFVSLCCAAAGPLALQAARAADGAISAEQWQRLIVQAAALDAAARIELVNAVVNRWLIDSDDAGRADWPTPAEALARGRGDCRAFAILKFFTLLAAGHPEDDVRVLYTIRSRRATPGLQQPHLVAWARTAGAPPRVLDNLNPFAQPLSLRRDLRPLFSLDLRHLRRGAEETIDRPATALRPWREMLERRAGEAPQSLVDTSSTRPLRGFISQR
ncbi:MAG: transglutaminase-like cysteine peptidase [Piscinibacter sp.]|uniref:hypothetical protein n=1 Tax=Piscinibacter sp. TaxID=1903157 RepID=UPI00258537F1|nr:hypothetical protein [Piscinibacter sp.]MCW5662774.1 transglutaminase-like cysteine peptidase [Piscinibacter sp.]